MNSDEAIASQWIDTLIDTQYCGVQSRRKRDVEGLGGFDIRPAQAGWVFRLNLGQSSPALFGWSSTCRGRR